MFAIAVELLAGRYSAMHFNDRTEPEWPPHPARLYSAMVAAWADNDDPSDAERSALRWLEEQPSPSIHCSEVRRRDVVTHFVPVNDPTALTRDVSRTYALVSDARATLREAEEVGDQRAVDRARKALVKAEAKAVADTARAGAPTGRESDQVTTAVLEVLPERRGKQGRTYPTVVPYEATVWFMWPDAVPSDAHLQALDGLLARVARIGHSSTMVTCRAATDAPPPTLVPNRNGSALRLRVPRSGLIDRLERAYVSHQGSEPRLLPAAMTGYGPPDRSRVSLPAPYLAGEWYVLSVAGPRPPSAVRTLAIARAVRSALMAHGDQPPPELVSGHRAVRAGSDCPTAPLEQPHLAIAPLPSVGHRYSDGAIRGIALVLPADCGDEDRAALERALLAWQRAGLELMLPGGDGSRPVRLKLEGWSVQRATGERLKWLDTTLAARRRTTTRDYWCRPAQMWRSVTPIALDRFPGDLRSRNPQKRARAEAEAVEAVMRACVFAGLPRPTRVTTRLDSPLIGVPAPPSGARDRSRFPGYKTGRGEPRACVHAGLEFAEPVRGPVLVGAGRYFGYGLCLPINQ